MKLALSSWFVSIAFAIAAGPPADSSPARVLIVTGIDYPGHKWRETTPVLVEALTNDTRLKVDVLEDPYRLDVADLAPYRSLVLHFMNWEKPDPGEKARENLRSFVERGGGMVMIHFACGAFRDWPEFQNLAGRIYDRTNTHDPRGPFTVRIANTNHLITRGITSSFDVDDELYTCLAGDKPIDLLASARSRVTNRDHPMAFVHQYGKGRVFQTPLGHDVKALRSGETLALIRRGTLWTMGLEPKPAASSLLHRGPSTSSPDPRAHWDRDFNVPPGFSVQVIAAEPDILNPMSIAVDESGALWITEAHSYRWGTNGSPFQPPANPIRRLVLGPNERCASSIVALAGFPEPVIGIAAREGKVFATCLNELFVCDVASDGTLTNRTLLVRDAARPWNPFGMYRVQLGPDDKLWLSIADHPSSEPVTLTGSDGRRLRFAGQSGGLVRCDIDGSNLELIAHGLRAPYAFDIDPWGHIWQISNGEGSPNIFVHVIPGLDYGYASRRASYSWLAGTEPLSPPVLDMGAGANTAALHYYSSMFPRDYWGDILVANWGSHGENPSNREIIRFRRSANDITGVGTSDSALKSSGKFLTSTDPKFRPSGAALAPDGGLYVIDWHGRDDENDRTARVLKISCAASSPKASAARQGRSVSDLIAQLGDPNHLARQQAARELVKHGDTAVPGLAKAAASSDSFAAANVIWALTRISTTAAAQAMASGLRHEDARVRAHALRQLRQATGGRLLSAIDSSKSSPLRPLSPNELAALARPLLLDSDAEVRVEAALSQLTPGDITTGLTNALAISPNPRLVYQIGFQLSRHSDLATIHSLIRSTSECARRAALIAIDNARHEQTPLFALLSTNSPGLLAETPPAAFAEKLVWLRQHDPAECDKEWARLDQGDVTLVGANERIAALDAFASSPAKTAPARFLRASLNDSHPGLQIAALRALRQVDSDQPELLSRTLELAKNAKSDSVRIEATWTLGSMRYGGSPRDWAALVENPATRIAALRALRQGERSPEFSTSFLENVRAMERSQRELEELLLTLQALGVSEKDCATLGVIKPNQDRQVLAAAVLQRVPRGSQALGKLSFQSTRAACSKCHAVRPGDPSFGPNLATIGSASQPEYLLESILDPARVIKTGFETERIETKDGSSLSGLVESHGAEVLIRVSADERLTLKKDQILSRSLAGISGMPEGLDAGCTPSELADIIAYLLSLK